MWEIEGPDFAGVPQSQASTRLTYVRANVVPETSSFTHLDRGAAWENGFRHLSLQATVHIY